MEFLERLESELLAVHFYLELDDLVGETFGQPDLVDVVVLARHRMEEWVIITIIRIESI